MLALLLLATLPLDAATPTTAAAAASSALHLEAVRDETGAARAQIVNGTGRALSIELRTCSSFATIAGGKQQSLSLGACDDEPIELVPLAPGERLTLFLSLPAQARELRYRSKQPLSRGAWAGDLAAPITPWPAELAIALRGGPRVNEVLVDHRNVSGGPLRVLTDRCGAPIFDQLFSDGKPQPLAIPTCDKTIEHERTLAAGESFTTTLAPGLLPGPRAISVRYNVGPVAGRATGRATPFRGTAASPTVKWQAPW